MEYELDKKIGDVVYCIDRAVYPHQLTKRKAYQILNQNERNYKIKGDSGRLVWLAHDLFVASLEEIPAIQKITIDDPISKPLDVSIEVTIEFENGNKRWMIFMAPVYLEALLKGKSKTYLSGNNIMFLLEITSEAVNKAIYELDDQNELTKNSIPYE